MSKVVWERWDQTWAHVTGFAMGVYRPREKVFASSAEARGFAEGIKGDARNRFVEVRP